ncbi:MAG: helix-hairpin-helix domain-containing protein [Rikenellaceae bacterium]
MKAGFTDKEARGVIVFMVIISIVVGAQLFYKHIETQRYRKSLERLTPIADSLSMVRLFDFDPNVIELPELMRLGLTKSEAVSIIRYREYGKVFKIKEDLFTCYGISDSLYYALEPYIVIGEEFRLKRREEYEASNSYERTYSSRRYERELLPISEFLVDTVGANYLVAIGALSSRQAAVFVKWRDLSGIYDMNELRECYVVSDSIAMFLEPYAIFTPPTGMQEEELVDLNKADSAALRSVFGIGEKSVMAILQYRELLGGYYSVEQLSELKMITESNYEKIIQQILCDSCDISKIDVNFASAKIMKGHPYIADKALRKLLKLRELKGGWSTIEEMIEDNIFNEQEATRVHPYLLFGEFTEPKVSDDGFF